MSALRSVVAGASGLVGGCLARRLASDRAFGEVALVVRQELPSLSPKLRQRIVDFGALSPAALGRPDTVFCALGTTLARAGSEEAFRKVDLDAVVHLARHDPAKLAYCILERVALDTNLPGMLRRRT